jgi:hypothetical protein
MPAKDPITDHSISDEPMADRQMCGLQRPQADLPNIRKGAVAGFGADAETRRFSATAYGSSGSRTFRSL